MCQAGLIDVSSADVSSMLRDHMNLLMDMFSLSGQPIDFAAVQRS